MRYLPSHAQHIGSRHYQQDSVGFADPGEESFLAHGGFLSVLCDGMGGMEHGDVASQTAVRAILDAYASKTPEESIPAALERGAREANRRVIEAARRLGFHEGVGTTLVAAVIHERSLYFLSVGDSAVFHVHNGQARMVNRPHVFANLLDAAVASGQISRAEAEQHPERESLTSFIGIHVLEEIDHNTEAWPLAPGDTVLLASDGMFKTLDPAGISECLAGHPQSWPRALVERTLARQMPGQDNVTVVSITPDSGALPEWIPPRDESAFSPTQSHGRTTSMHTTAVQTTAAADAPAGNAWLVVAIFLLLVAIGVGGFWYFSSP
jgi:serine/threonine protein phosphatase PrpC